MSGSFGERKGTVVGFVVMWVVFPVDSEGDGRRWMCGVNGGFW